MIRPTLRGAHRRRLLTPVAAGLLAGALLLLPIAAPAATSQLPLVGAAPASAQGGMDVSILLPSFSDLPLSVQLGQSFPLVVNTAPGAQCAGRISFRGAPTIELDAQPASAGTCTWPIDVPPAARPGTATIGIDFNRGGQGWFLAGVVYVNPVGESR